MQVLTCPTSAQSLETSQVTSSEGTFQSQGNEEWVSGETQEWLVPGWVFRRRRPVIHCLDSVPTVRGSRCSGRARDGLGLDAWTNVGHIMLHNMNKISNILMVWVFIPSPQSCSLQTLPSSKKEGEKMPSGKDKNTTQREGLAGKAG